MKSVSLVVLFALPALVVSSLRTSLRKSKDIDDDDDDDDGDGYEHGDAAESLDENDGADSDFSVHDILTPDEGRDGSSNEDNHAMDDGESFNSEDTPAEDQDSFFQKKSVNLGGKHHKRGRKGKHSKKGADDDDDEDGDEFEHGDAATSLDDNDIADSDFSMHQFVTSDDARDGPTDGGSALAGRSEDDDFNSEDTPAVDQDSLAQTKSVKGAKKKVWRKHSKHSRKGVDDDDDSDEFEHGDAATSLDDNDSADSDFSVHQFVTVDDARDGPSDGGNAKSSQGEDDDFNSEDTPASDQDSFAQLKSVKNQRKAVKHAGRKRGLSHSRKGADDDDDGDEYEHGDASESLDENENADSDFSMHQFIAQDDARDGPDDAAAARRSGPEGNENNDFNSEDTPAVDQDD